MKKIIALVLALVMVFALAACGTKSQPTGSVTPADGEKTDVSGTVENKDDAATTDDTAKTEEPAQTDTTETEPATQEPTAPEESVTAPETVETSDDEEFAIGGIVGGKYENAFFGIGVELDENWTFYTKEQLAELDGVTAAAMTDENVAKSLESGKTAFDMYAYAEDGLISINVVMENLGVLYGKILDESAYADAAMPQLAPALEEQGFSDVTCEKQAITFAGAEHQAVKIHGLYKVDDSTSFDFYKLLVCVKSGDYMAVVTFGSSFEDITTDLASAFYAV